MAYNSSRFSNANGVSFGTVTGLSGNVVTASVAAAGGAQTGISGLSAGTTQMTSGTAVFSNSNGITFGVNGNTITASYNSTQFQSTGNYLTTAAQSNQVVNSLNGSTGQISLNVGSSLSASTNGSSITFGLASNITTALQSANINYLISQSNQAFSASGGSSAFQTLNFANSNGITFSNSNGSVIASHNGLTTARASTDAVGLNTAQSNVTWTVNSNGISFDARGYVGTATAFSGTNVSATMTHNSAGFSLQLSAPSAAAGNVTFSAGTTSSGINNVTFSNANGVSFGLGTGASAGVITATVATNYQSQGAYLTTAMASNRGSDFVQATAVFNGTNASGTIASGAISVSVNAQSVQTQNVYQAVLSGNTAGAMATISSGTMTIAGGNNITVSQNGNAFTISGANVGGAQTGISGIQVSNTTYTSGTVTWQNANGISFGSSGVNGISASYTVPSTAGLISAINVSGGTTSNNLSAITFSNSNGVSFGLNGSVMTASHNGLTTARASNDAVGLATALTAGPLAWTVNSAGISLNAGSAAGTTSGFGGNLISGSMTHNTAGLNLSLNHPAWLTTAMQSNAVTLSNINISAGTTSSNQSSLGFSNGNGVSFGFSGASITASHNALTSQSNQNITAANGGFAFQTLSFSNLNGISFGTSAGSAITASHNGLTTARASNDGIGLNTAQSNVTWTVNSSGLSLDARGYAGTASTFNGTNVSGSITLNSNGLRLDLSAGAGGGVTPAVSGSNGSFSFSTVTFGNLNGLSFYTSNGSLVGSYTVPAGGASPNFSAGTTSNNLGSVVFSNSNGVSFGLNGSTITASVNAGGGGGINLIASNTTFTSGTVSFNQSGALTIGTGAQAINFSVPATSSLVGAMGVSLSTDGSTVSIQKYFQSTYVPMSAFSTNSQTLGVLGASSASARFFPIYLSDNVAFNVLQVMHNLSYATSSVSGQQSVTYRFGLYSNNANSLSLISSNSFSLAVTNSSISHTVSYPNATGTDGYTYTTLTQNATANIQSFWGTAAGGRPVGLQFGNSMTLSSGAYWLGVLIRHSSSSANIGISIGINGNANAVHNNLAGFGQASSAQTTNYSIRRGLSGLGAYTVSQSTLPNGVAFSQIAHTQTIMPLISFLSTT